MYRPVGRSNDGNGGAMQQADANRAYELPSVRDLGTLAEFTLGGNNKNKTDAQFAGIGQSVAN